MNLDKLPETMKKTGTDKILGKLAKRSRIKT
jgi:hypothetical protein